MKYDFLCVGAGPFNCTFARLATDAGKKVLVIDRRDRIGGNTADQEMDGIMVQLWSIHAFHTSNKAVWKFVNRFATFNSYQHRVKASSDGSIYSFPPNRAMFDQLGTDDKQIIFQRFFSPYSYKQWGAPASEEVINRIPWRTTYNDNYFDDKYQGLPIGGYTKMFEKMLEGIDVKLNTEWNGNTKAAKQIIFTGDIASLVGKELPYRTLKFKLEKINLNDMQGCSQVNYPDPDVSYTRCIEFKHLYGSDTLPHTWIMWEYPGQAKKNDEKFYPIPGNEQAYEAIKQEVKEKYHNLIPCGRLGSYKYMDMHVVIASAMALAKKLLEDWNELYN